MTPQEYLTRLDALIEAECWQGALDFSAAAIGQVHPELSFRDLERVHGAMEVAANIVTLEREAERQPDRARA